MSPAATKKGSHLEQIATELANILARRSEKVVFAESCTAGLISSTLGAIPGISNCLCGSAVVYRADTKKKWLGVKKKTIKLFTTESPEMSMALAKNILKRTPEANWSLGIVGHLGPDAPSEKDGCIYVSIGHRTKKGKGKIKLFEHKLIAGDRFRRQQQAAEYAISRLAQLIGSKSKQSKDE